MKATDSAIPAPPKYFKPGDRVMVYGWVQMHCNPYKPRGGGKARIAWVSGSDIHVHFDAAANGEKGGDSNHYPAHPKQLRRLIKKPKAERWTMEEIGRAWNIGLPGTVGWQWGEGSWSHDMKSELNRIAAARKK